MHKKLLSAVSLILTVLLVLPLALSCSDAPAVSEETTAAPAGEVSDTVEPESTEEIDTRFIGVNYDDRPFRVQTSVDTTDATNANALIEGSGELNGELLNDAVFNRNALVEELLGVKLEFTQSNYTYDTAASGIRTLILSASDDFDLIINDIRSLASLTVEGYFHNIYSEPNFDYSKTYWYRNMMEDLQLVDGYMYGMMGDYFMDIIASCHALFYNKDLCGDMFGDPNMLYNMVLDGTWTYENMCTVVEASYIDLNGDSKTNEGDQFGFTVEGTWGSAIPFVGSSGNHFVDRSSGTPEFALDEERSYYYLEMLNKLWYGPGTINDINAVNANFAIDLRNLFANHQTLIVGYQRLGDLANMRDIDFDIGVIPYPKLYETDEYITSTHDTTEIGVIPVTMTDLPFATTCIEVLTRETSKNVMFEYYETALKVKYTTDTMSASMIDLIHDSFDTCFPLAYDNSFNAIMLQSFTNKLANKSNDFASEYNAKLKAANKLLDKMLTKLIENCEPAT